MPKHYVPRGKKKVGSVAKYVTRNQAIKYLQVSLSLFRKLCIFKGVFPREPKKKVKGNHHSYYHMKDIMFLKYEPLLEKFREMETYEKKIMKAKSKKNKELVDRLLAFKPSYTLDKIILERYPKFIDALRDLDHCLAMVHLFAALPATGKEKIEVARIHNCRRLAHEWQAYISRTHKLRKTFISVKGIYYQAEVEGQKITWLTPHALQQVLPDDVDYEIMLTFLEFYEGLLGFVNFKLYHDINVKYPPILDPGLEALALDLYALERCFDVYSKLPKIYSKDTSSSASQQIEDQKDAPKLDESKLDLVQLQHQLPLSEPGSLMHRVEGVGEEDDHETVECKNLFKSMKFFLNREIPRDSLLFIIPAFGGVVSWEGEGAPFKEADQSITHQIVDRPTQGHTFLSREYVQPQWVFDCINARIILPTDKYMVGKVPPPHLSPFVDNEAEGYIPEYAEEIKRLQAAARKEVLPMPGAGKEDFVDVLAEGIIDRAEEIEAAKKKRKLEILQKEYVEELKMEIEGIQHSPAVANVSEAGITKGSDIGGESLPDIEQLAEDSNSMSKILMPRKKRRLYEAIQISKGRKRAHVEVLKERKRKIEAKKSD